MRRDRIATSTIASDDTDLRLLRQPGLSRGRLSVGQESDRRMSFKIADQRAVAGDCAAKPSHRCRQSQAEPRFVVHARRTMRNSVSLLTLTLSRREKGGSRSASKRNGEAVDHIVELLVRCSWPNGLEPFGKDPPLANRCRRRRSDASAKSALFACLRLEDPPSRLRY